MKLSYINQYFIGDCISVLKENIPDKSIDCVITSPPYAEQRVNQYGGIPEEDYPAWTVEYMQEIKRVLTDTGSVAIVIRPHIKEGQISDYMLKTRLALREDGWNEAEELIWIKNVSPALGSLLRPRRSWESIHWFSKISQPYCDLKAAGKNSKGVGFIKNKGVGDYIGSVSKGKEGIARVPDYIAVGTNSNDRSPENIHPAQYPVELVEWLIKLLCPINGIVLDPFFGSGTTAVAAMKNNRKWVGIEINEKYEEIIKKHIKEKHQDYVTY